MSKYLTSHSCHRRREYRDIPYSGLYYQHSTSVLLCIISADICRLISNAETRFLSSFQLSFCFRTRYSWLYGVFLKSLTSPWILPQNSVFRNLVYCLDFYYCFTQGKRLSPYIQIVYIWLFSLSLHVSFAFCPSSIYPRITFLFALLDGLFLQTDLCSLSQLVFIPILRDIPSVFHCST